MYTQSQESGFRAPVFGIASLTVPLIAIGLWFMLTNPIAAVYAILVLTALGVALALLAGRRREAYRLISNIGLLLNGGGFLYVFLALFI
jgi:hypothetical protein